jgi:predicted nucleic acid-binding protein
MRRYLIGTSVLAAYLYSRQTVVSPLSRWVNSRQAATSILVYGEIVEHLKRRSEFEKHRSELRELLTEISPYFVTYTILERYADIRRQLRPQGQLIGDIDTLIAATALERGLTVVTTDEDYERVPDLQVSCPGFDGDTSRTETSRS